MEDIKCGQTEELRMGAYHWFDWTPNGAALDIEGDPAWALNAPATAQSVSLMGMCWILWAVTGDGNGRGCLSDGSFPFILYDSYYQVVRALSPVAANSVHTC